jgi:hypothetical protein
MIITTIAVAAVLFFTIIITHIMERKHMDTNQQEVIDLITKVQSDVNTVVGIVKDARGQLVTLKAEINDLKGKVDASQPVDWSSLKKKLQDVDDTLVAAEDIGSSAQDAANAGTPANAPDGTPPSSTPPAIGDETDPGTTPGNAPPAEGGQ